MLVNRFIYPLLLIFCVLIAIPMTSGAQEAEQQTYKGRYTADTLISLVDEEDRDYALSSIGIRPVDWEKDPRIATIATPRATCYACEKLARYLSDLEDRRLGRLLQMDEYFQQIDAAKRELRSRGEALRLDVRDYHIAPYFLPEGVTDYAIATDERLRAIATELIRLLIAQDELANSFQSLQDAAAETLKRFAACEKYYCPISTEREVAFLQGRAAGDVYWVAEQANGYTGLNIHSAFALRDGLTDDFSQAGSPPPPPPTPIPDPEPEDPAPEPDPDPAPEPEPTPDPDPAPEPDPGPDPDPAPDPDPTPEPEPEPTPGLLIVAGPGSISQTHEVGGNACPQALGTLTLRNDGETQLTFNITGVAPWMSINSGQPGNNLSGTLAPGESRSFPVDFVCDFFGASPAQGNPTNVSTILLIDTSTAGASGSGSVPVSLSIQNED